MTLVLQPLTFLQFVGIIVFGIFTIFIAIRLWSYAFFKSKFEQYSNKVSEISKKIL